MSGMKFFLITFTAFFAAAAFAQQPTDQVGVSPGSRARYATDAYPGFDFDKESLSPERKEPRWFSFFNGPKCETAAAQYSYCQSLEAEESWSKAAKEYDALVREWPASEEAPAAQLRLAEILFEKEDDCPGAFAEYRYLIDFYSFRCDYNAAVNRMYEIAGRMREEGKTIVFFRFGNTVEVRRAYERCVLCAPGAAWAPDAMLAIGILREDEDKPDEAVKVYENLRNLHFGTEQAKVALLREARVRMEILGERGYNRERCLDTVRFLDLALRTAEGEEAEALRAMRDDASGRVHDEDYRAALFYDSRMRTSRSAISAYERFLADHPESVRAEEVRRRLGELKGER